MKFFKSILFFVVSIIGLTSCTSSGDDRNLNCTCNNSESKITLSEAYYAVDGYINPSNVEYYESIIFFESILVHIYPPYRKPGPNETYYIHAYSYKLNNSAIFFFDTGKYELFNYANIDEIVSKYKKDSYETLKPNTYFGHFVADELGYLEDKRSSTDFNYHFFATKNFAKKVGIYE